MTDADMISEADQLRQELAGFLDGVGQAAALDPRVALATGHDIVDRLHRVLEGWADLSDDAREQVRQTVAYVVAPNDGAHDFFDAAGLVDDEEQVTQLERQLGR
jgi:bacterioferritin (cytochrome b1)